MKNKIKFDKGNNILYMQDFGFYRGIPDNIFFGIEPIGTNSIVLTSKGHGKISDYGNGGLYVSIDDLPENIRDEVNGILWSCMNGN